MNNNSHVLCIWAGPLAVACFIGSGACTGFAFPISSGLSPEEIVAFFRAHLEGIRVAGLLMTFCAAFMMMFACAISAQLQRVEGGFSPWTFVQLLGGLMGNLPFFLTGIIWTAIAFRLDRPPAVTQAMNDLSWFILEMPAATAVIQFFAIIAVTLGDKSADPVFPRWVAYANIAASILFLPGAAGGIFVDWKPMDWDGFVAYWMPALASASWVWIMFAALLRAQARARAAAGRHAVRSAPGAASPSMGGSAIG